MEKIVYRAVYTVTLNIMDKSKLVINILHQSGRPMHGTAPKWPPYAWYLWLPVNQVCPYIKRSDHICQAKNIPLLLNSLYEFY